MILKKGVRLVLTPFSLRPLHYDGQLETAAGFRTVIGQQLQKNPKTLAWKWSLLHFERPQYRHKSIALQLYQLIQESTIQDDKMDSMSEY